MDAYFTHKRTTHRVALYALLLIFISTTMEALAAERYEIDGYSIDTFDGRDRGQQYSGAWVDVRGLKVDGKLLKSKLGFEFSSRYDQEFRFWMGISSFRTFFPGSAGNWSERNHAQLGDRFSLQLGPSRVNNLSQIRHFYRSLSNNDKQFFEATCHLIGNKAFMAEVRTKLVQSGRGTDFTYRSFWGSHKRAIQMSDMGELCLKGIGEKAENGAELLFNARIYRSNGSTTVLKKTTTVANSSNSKNYRACVTWEERPDFKRVQQALKDMGYYFGPINGALGSQACAALRGYAEKSTSGPTYFSISETKELYGKVRQIPQSAAQKTNEKFCGVNIESTPMFSPDKIPDIKNLQSGLRSKGFLWGSVDGVAGPQTCKAFISYIAAEGQNGKLGVAALSGLIRTGKTSLRKDAKTVMTSAKDNAPIKADTQPGSAKRITGKADEKLLEKASNLQTALTNNARKLETLELQNANLRAQNKQLSYQSEGLKSEKDQLGSKVKLLEFRIDALNAELTKTESDSAQLKIVTSKRDSLAKVIESKDKLLISLRRSLKEKDELITALKQSLKDSNRELELREQELSSLNSGDQARSGVIEALNEKLSEAAIEIALVTQDRKIADQQSKSFETELLKARSDARSFEARIKDLETRLVSAQNAAEASPELEAEKIRSAKLSQTNAELTTKLSMLEQELVSYRESEARKTDWIDDLSLEWSARLSDMPVQQRQFCNIANKFRKDLDEARSSRNQIRINMTFQERQESLDSLLPDGDFRDWIVRVISVGQMPDGSARFVAEMPCKTMIGSGVVGRGNDASWVATIGHRSRMYRELAKVSAGDFIAVQGGLLEVEAFEPGQPESFYGVNQIGDNPHPEVKALGLDGELFISRVDYLIMLRQ